MRLITYNNLRIGTALQGALGNNNTLAIRARSTSPDIALGDVIQLTADPAQRYLVHAIDVTGLALKGRLRHIEASVTPVTGTATVSRLTSTTNAFGRPA